MNMHEFTGLSQVKCKQHIDDDVIWDIISMDVETLQSTIPQGEAGSKMLSAASVSSPSPPTYTIVPAVVKCGKGFIKSVSPSDGVIVVCESVCVGFNNIIPIHNGSKQLEPGE